MSQLNDCIHDSLVAQGFLGQVNDQLLAWALAGGATSNQLNDALLEMLLLNGATSKQINDAWYEALIAVGITAGHINDMKLEFWCVNGGAFSLQASLGWTGNEDCA